MDTAKDVVGIALAIMISVFLGLGAAFIINKYLPKDEPRIYVCQLLASGENSTFVMKCLVK